MGEKERFGIINFLAETLEILKRNDKSPEDVRWIGSEGGDYAISWAEFSKLADFEYDSQSGPVEIADNLIVVGEGWWLNRFIDRAVYDDVGGEYQEEWTFHQYNPTPFFPEKRDNAKSFTKLRRWEQSKVVRDAQGGISGLMEG